MNDPRQQLAENFEQALSRLNTEQKQAVAQIEGPVMVIAGPGTGKTQILAARIGNILKETDTQADNILCLTYTDAGAVAMRQRLQKFIGAEAYRVRINTFHAFCNDVIQDHLYLFEKSELEAVSDLERLELIKRITVEFEKSNILKRYSGDVDYEIQRLSNLYENMKRESWSPEYLKKQIAVYLEELPQRDEYHYKTSRKGSFQKGDLKEKDLKKETDRIRLTEAAVSTFERYQNLMLEKGRYDFADMINWVIDAFKSHEDLLAEYKEQFQYILVDEFQDTSGSQNELLSLLLGKDENPNVFVVGDDDQSIYRFQGANVKNMLDFAERYVNHLVTIVLTVNYRSVQPVLDVSKAVIENNQERLVNQLAGLKKVLTSGNEDLKDLNIQPVLKIYQNPFSEMVGIATAIERLIHVEQILPEKIAVIYRKNKYGKALSQYFQLKEIPFYIKNRHDLLQDPFIKKLLAILDYIASEIEVPYSGDALLFEILHYDFYQIAPNEIARMVAEVSRKKGNEKTSLRNYLHHWLSIKNPTLFDLKPHENILKTARAIEQRLTDAFNKTLIKLIETVIREDGFLHTALKSEQKIWDMQLLTSFFDFVKSETRRHPDLTIGGLMNTIRLMKRNHLSLEINKTLESGKGVNLLTAHGSKGLEFETVFIAGCQADFWEKSRNFHKSYKLPDNIMEASSKGIKEEEERRLFFVAVTRAEKQLFLSWPQETNEGKSVDPSSFIAEITDEIALPEQNVIPTDEEKLTFAALDFTEEKAPVIEKAESLFIDSLLTKFSMNVTALNNYLDCPLKFYYNNLIRVPSGRSEATEFGSAVHHALEKLFRRMQDSGDDTFPPVKTFLNDFNWYMQHHRESFTKEAFDRRSEYGEMVLTDYYDHYVDEWSKVVSVERRFSNIVVDGIPLKGAMDKLEFNGNLVNVVDYKTGKVDRPSTKEKLLPPNDKNPDGGNYWRQAVFYRILLDHYKLKDWKVTSTEFDFVEPDKNKQYITHRIDITPEDIHKVLEQIKDSWGKIQNHDFYTGCGKEDCYWCNFVKENHLQPVPEEEG